MSDRAQNVARARELRAQGLLLREVAERMGVAVQTVSAWINDPDGSRLRARKDSYRGECAECGGPTCGGDGPTNTPMLCAACIQWTDGQIIDAIRAWAEVHGGIPPKELDWQWAPADRSHPSGGAVVRRMGWNEAILRAGFSVRCDRRPETQAEIERQIRAGVSVREIAGEFGVSPDAIYGRLRYRGLSVHDVRVAA